MQEISNNLGCVLIFLSSSRACPIQTIVPIQVEYSSPLIIAIGQNGFFDTYSLPEPVDEVKGEDNGCKCGRNVEFACDSIACPCHRKKIPCWKEPECHCFNCINRYGMRLTVRDKEKSCKCPKGGCDGYRCPCWRRGASCLTDPR